MIVLQVVLPDLPEGFALAGAVRQSGFDQDQEFAVG
jgi:hypothetical protein